MAVTLKFVKGAFLSTYKERGVERCPEHVVQVDKLLRIKSATKPPKKDLPTFDLTWEKLANVREVRIKASKPDGEALSCSNDVQTLNHIVEDEPVSDQGNLISINVVGGRFCYPHSMVELPHDRAKQKRFGWIQVDFPAGPVTLELIPDGGSTSTYTVHDGQAFDVAGYIMYKREEGSLDEEPLPRSAGGSGSASFKVLEQSDGTGSPPKVP